MSCFQPIAGSDDDGEEHDEDGHITDVHNLLRPRADRKAPIGGKWTMEEDNQLKDIVKLHGAKNWKKVTLLFEKLENSSLIWATHSYYEYIDCNASW